jgi:hypothetical protein
MDVKVTGSQHRITSPAPRRGVRKHAAAFVG